MTTINAGQLRTALSRIESGWEGAKQYQHGFVRITFDGADSCAEIAAYNDRLRIRDVVCGTSGDPLDIIINATALKDSLFGVLDQDITLAPGESTATIQCGRRKAVIPTLEISDFNWPQQPALTLEHRLVLDLDKWKAPLWTCANVAKRSPLDEYKVVNIMVKNGDITVASTDRRIAAVYQFKGAEKKAGVAIDYAIPCSVIHLAISLCETSTKTITLAFLKNKVGFTVENTYLDHAIASENVQIATKSLQFVSDAKPEHSAKVNRKALKTAIQAASLINEDVHMTIDVGGIKIESKKDAQAFNDEVPADTFGHNGFWASSEYLTIACSASEEPDALIYRYGTQGIYFPVANGNIIVAEKRPK